MQNLAWLSLCVWLCLNVTQKSKSFVNDESLLLLQRPIPPEGMLRLTGRILLVTRVTKDAAMNEATSKLIRLANQEHKTVFDLELEKHPEVGGILSKFKPENNRTFLKQSLVRQKLEQHTAESFYHALKEAKQNVFAEVFILRGVHEPKAQDAKGFAARMYEQVKAGIFARRPDDCFPRASQQNW